jgi:hypothetical protein
MTVMAWPTLDVYLDTTSAPLTAADFTANITNLTSRANIGNLATNGILSFSSSIGRANAQSYFDVGTLTFTVDNQNGQFDPTYTSAIPNLRVGNHVTLVATPSGGSASSVFSGYIASFQPAYGVGYETMTITATDMFKLLNLLTWQPSSPVAAQTADVRVKQILTDCGFSSSWVVTPSPAPTSICAAIPANPDTGLMDHSEQALGAMQAAVHDTEDGLLYVRGDGRLVVASRMLRAGPVITPTATFGDLFSSGTEIPYEPSIVIANDDTLLLNGYTVTDSFGASATYSDATSISKYGPYYGSATSLSATPNENMDEAQFRVQTNDTMGTRIDQITITPVQTAAIGDFAALLPASPGWQFESASLTVNRRPPSGNLITQNCFVEGVAQSFDGASWSTQLGLSNASLLAGFSSSWLLLNDATFGKLNTGALGR